jgi:hypothetical protein
MTTNNARTEQEFIASQKAKTSSKGFAPTGKSKKPSPANTAASAASATAAADSTTPPHSSSQPQGVTSLDDTTRTIATAIGSMSDYSTRSTETLATQREVIADRVADQMAALLDPDLFLQEVMARTVAKLNPRTVEIPNFFDIALNLPPTPTVRQLPANPESAP